MSAHTDNAAVARLLEGLNDPQRDAVTHVDGPLLILAGAGSGKTRVLAHRVAYLIRGCRVKPEQVLAITFTNKAAGEMRERIEALVGPVARIMWISTFHSMCARILRREAERLGYKATFSIYDADDSKRLVNAAVSRSSTSTSSAFRPTRWRARSPTPRTGCRTPRRSASRSAAAASSAAPPPASTSSTSASSWR